MVEANPVLEKYAGITKIGLQAFREGMVEPFKGLVGLENRFNVSIRFSENSDQLIRERVVDYMRADAPFFEVIYFVAGEKAGTSYPIHTTIQEGVYEGNDVVEGYRILTNLRKESRIKEALTEVYYTEIVFDHFLPSKETFILAAGKIPVSIIYARQRIADVYKEYGLNIINLDNILHSTVGRILKLPRRDNLDYFLERLLDIHKGLQEEPIRATTISAFIGTASELLSKE